MSPWPRFPSLPSAFQPGLPGSVQCCRACSASSSRCCPHPPHCLHRHTASQLTPDLLLDLHCSLQSPLSHTQPALTESCREAQGIRFTQWICSSLPGCTRQQQLWAVCRRASLAPPVPCSHSYFTSFFFLFFFQEKIPFLPKYDNGATTSSAYLSGVLHCYASSVTAQSLYLEGGSLSPAEPRQQLQCGGKSSQNQRWASGGRWAGCGQVIGGHCSGRRAPSKRCIPSASRQALPGQMLQPTAERLPAAERTVCCCADRSCERRPVCKLWHFGTESKYLLPKST